MKRSTDRILTTHVGSIIRPPALREFARARQAGEAVDQDAFDRCLRESVAEVVKQQVRCGIDIPNDGEFGKSTSWSQYALKRLSGFELRAVSGPNPLCSRPGPRAI
jgi:5-methyltetrahydropteroyltriglutamate--homocysteine methyltransferase